MGTYKGETEIDNHSSILTPNIVTQVATYTIFRALQPVFIQVVHSSAVFCGIACSAEPEDAQSNRLCYKWQLAL